MPMPHRFQERLVFTYGQDRIPPAVRGIIKVFLACAIIGVLYFAVDLLLARGAHWGWWGDDVQVPRYGAQYALAAIALSYQSQPDLMHRSFLWRFIGVTAGVILGSMFWLLPLGTPITVMLATAAGWGVGVYIGGMAVADKAAFFAGATALMTSDQFGFSLASRLAGTFLGYVAVYVVIMHVWPADGPEEPRRRAG